MPARDRICLTERAGVWRFYLEGIGRVWREIERKRETHMQRDLGSGERGAKGKREKERKNSLFRRTAGKGRGKRPNPVCLSGQKETGSGQNLSLKGTGYCLDSFYQVTGQASIIMIPTPKKCFQFLTCSEFFVFWTNINLFHTILKTY